MPEMWKSIVGFETLYAISDQGRIRIVQRQYRSCWQVGHVLRSHDIGRSYQGIQLNKDGVRFNYKVHQIVAAAFIGPCPDGYQINHKNMDKGDNRVENLEYVTQSQNMRHRIRNNGGHKLKVEDVRDIRRAAKRGISQGLIALQFGLAPSTISRILSGKRWAHVS